MTGKRRAASSHSSDGGVVPKRLKKLETLRDGVFQNPNLKDLWFKFKAREDPELQSFQNVTVTAYKGQPPSKIDEDTNPNDYSVQRSTAERFPPVDSSGGPSNLCRSSIAEHIDSAQKIDTNLEYEEEVEHEEKDASDDHAPNSEETDGETDSEAHEDSEDWEGEYDIADEFESGAESDEDSDAGYEQVGCVFGRLINRGQIRRTFWRDMEAPSQDTAALAFNVFDRYGCVRETFVTGAQKGSGIWGHEIDTGNLLQIEIVNVNLAFRRQGIARFMLQALMEACQNLDKSLRVALAWPTFLRSNAPQGVSDAEHRILFDKGESAAIALFHGIGFRRVGATVWFAHAFGANHASQRLSVADDFNPTTETLSNYKKLMAQLEKKRTKEYYGMMTIVISDRFQGHDAADVKQVLELCNTQAPDRDTSARVKHGCSCNACLDGFLSPRMACLMKMKAEMEYDMCEEIGDIDWDEFSTPIPYDYLPLSVKPYMKGNKSNRAGLREIFRHIVTCLDANLPPTVTNILAAVDDATEWPPHTQNFLKRAGVAGIEAVLRGLFDTMQYDDLKTGGIDIIAYHNECPPEDQTLGWNWTYENGMIFWEEMLKLKECRNDSEYGFMLNMLLGRLADSSLQLYEE